MVDDGTRAGLQRVMLDQLIDAVQDNAAAMLANAIKLIYPDATEVETEVSVSLRVYLSDGGTVDVDGERPTAEVSADDACDCLLCKPAERVADDA